MKINPINYNHNYCKEYYKTSHNGKISFESGKAVYAGSFDPITLGHLDLIKEASNIFDKLIVLIAKNPKKQGFLPVEKRMQLIEQSVRDLKNVEVDTFEGLTVDYAKQHDAKYLLRGMRSVSDFDNEMQISKINEVLNPNIKTVFLFSSSENSAISSSTVREILANHGDFKRFVPKPVFDYLSQLNFESNNIIKAGN